MGNTKPAKETKSRLASVAAIGTIMIGLLTIAGGLFTTNNTLKINSLKNTLATQLAKEKGLNDAMVDIREFLLIEQDNCNDDKYLGDVKQLRKNIIKIIFPLVKEIMTTDEVFNLAIILKAQAFVSMVYDNKNICAKTFPKEKDLIKLHRSMNLDIRKFTNGTRKEMADLEAGIFGIF